MSGEPHQHLCHGTQENTFSSLFGDDPEQNLIRKKIRHSEVIVEYQIHCPVIARSARPGQFVIVRGDDKGERVPLTIADYDATTGTLTLVMQIVGLASHKLDEFDEGDKFRDIVGPLGHASEIENFGTVVLVGGGLGIAPVYPIQRALKESSPSSVRGTKIYCSGKTGCAPPPTGSSSCRTTAQRAKKVSSPCRSSA